MEKEVVKIIKDLFEHVDESIELLQKIDKKLDIQASSKLRGQLEMLGLLTSSKKKEQTSFKICLGNLYELTEYYKSLTDQTIKEFGDIYGNHKIKFLLVSTPKAWARFGRKVWQKHVMCFARILDYASLWLLSEAAAIICLAKLKYSSQAIEDRERRLGGAFISVFKFIIYQAMEMMVLADASCLYGPLTDNIDILPENWKKSGSLSDRLKARMYAYMTGENALRSLIRGFANFMAISSLVPDCSKFPELDDPSYSVFHGGIANKAFERDRDKRWHDFLGASKQR